MKVILLDELAGKGHEGDVVDVARGFAVNYLLPRKLAVKATSGNLKQLESRRDNIEKRDAARRSVAEGIAIQILVDRSGSMQAMDFHVNGKPVDRLAAVLSVWILAFGCTLRPSDLDARTPPDLGDRR